MSNPNNCEACEYKAMNDGEDGHCYMFKNEPTEVCMRHTGRISITARLLADLIVGTDPEPEVPVKEQ